MYIFVLLVLCKCSGVPIAILRKNLLTKILVRYLCFMLETSGMLKNSTHVISYYGILYKPKGPRTDWRNDRLNATRRGITGHFFLKSFFCNTAHLNTVILTLSGEYFHIYLEEMYSTLQYSNPSSNHILVIDVTNWGKFSFQF